MLSLAKTVTMRRAVSFTDVYSPYRFSSVDDFNVVGCTVMCLLPSVPPCFHPFVSPCIRAFLLPCLHFPQPTIVCHLVYSPHNMSMHLHLHFCAFVSLGFCNFVLSHMRVLAPSHQFLLCHPAHVHPYIPVSVHLFHRAMFPLFRSPAPPRLRSLVLSCLRACVML